MSLNSNHNILIHIGRRDIQNNFVPVNQSIYLQKIPINLKTLKYAKNEHFGFSGRSRERLISYYIELNKVTI